VSPNRPPLVSKGVLRLTGAMLGSYLCIGLWAVWLGYSHDWVGFEGLLWWLLALLILPLGSLAALIVQIIKGLLARSGRVE